MHSDTSWTWTLLLCVLTGAISGLMPNVRGARLYSKVDMILSTHTLICKIDLQQVFGLVQIYTLNNHSQTIFYPPKRAFSNFFGKFTLYPRASIPLKVIITYIFKIIIIHFCCFDTLSNDKAYSKKKKKKKILWTFFVMTIISIFEYNPPIPWPNVIAQQVEKKIHCNGK